MKTSYINNVPVAEGEVSVVISSNANDTMRHSCKLAGSLHESGLNILLVNCGMSSQRFHEHAPDNSVVFRYDELAKYGEVVLRSKDKSIMATMDSYRGDLAGQCEAIREMVRQCGIHILILSGWEWASSTYRRRERVLYALREMMEEEHVTVVVYAQSRRKPTAGENIYGGLGRLASIAFEITDLRGIMMSEHLVPTKPPMVVPAEDWAMATQSALALIHKINTLEREKKEKEAGEAERKTREEGCKAEDEKSPQNWSPKILRPIAREEIGNWYLERGENGMEEMVGV